MTVMPLLTQKLGPHCLYKLYCFYFVVYWGNYRKASDYLNLSPYTLSKMIKALEGRLNCTLLRRKTQSPLCLTAEGSHVYAYSKQFVALFEDLEQSLGRVPQLKIYTVYLAVSEWIGCDYFLEALQQFKVDHPECLLQLKTGGSADQCFINQHEIWISTSPHHRSEGIAKLLLELKTALYTSPAYVQTNPPIQCVNDLKQHRAIYWQGEDPRVLAVLNWHRPFTQDVFDPDLSHYSSVTLMKMAEMGFGLISWFQDHPALQRSALVEIGSCLMEQSPCLQLYFHCSASLWVEPCIQSLYQRLKTPALFNGEKSHDSKRIVAKRSTIDPDFLGRLFTTISRRTRMIIDLKDDLWKEEALRVHALLVQELSKDLDRVWAKTMAYQKALQAIGNLNGFIETEATEASYQHRHAELFELCTELQIKDRVIEKIQAQFGPECFFIALEPK